MLVKSILIAVCFYCITFCAIADNQSDIHKLKQIIKKSPSPIDQAKAMISLSEYYKITQLDTFLFLNENALKIINNILHHKVYEDKSMLLESKAEILLNFGHYHYTKSNTIKAMKYFLQANKLAKEISHIRVQTLVISSMAKIKMDKGEYVLAYDDLIDFLNKNKTIDKRSKSITYHRISQILFLLENYDLARSYAYMELAINEEISDTNLIISTLGNLGMNYTQTKDLDSSLYFCKKALDLSIKKGRIDQVLNTRLNLANVYYYKGDFNYFKELHMENLHIIREYKIKNLWAIHLGNLIELSLKQNELIQAEQFMIEFDSIMPDIVELRLKSLYYSCKQKIAEINKDYKTAYEAKKKFDEIDEKFRNKKMDKQITAKEIEIKKEKEKELLDIKYRYSVELRKQKENIRLYTGIGFLFLLLSATYLYIRHRKKVGKLEREKLAQEVELKNMELTSFTLRLNQNNEYLRNIDEITKNIDSSRYPELNNTLSKLKNNIKMGNRKDKDWITFQKHFNELNPDFVSRLSREYDSLTPNDIRLCSLLKLNVPIHEIANVLGVKVESIWMTKHRIHKKMNLTHGEKLADFIIKL